MGKVRVLYLIGKIFHISGGTERHVSQLISSLEQARFEPHLAVLEHTAWLETEYFPCPRYSLDGKAVSRAFLLPKIFDLMGYIHRHDIHIVETYFPNAHFVGAIAGRTTGRIVVSSRRDLGYWHTRKTLWMARFANRCVTRFLANSKAVAQSNSQIEGVELARFTTICNGIDIAKLHVAEEATRRIRDSLGIATDQKIVGLVANFRAVKDVKGFIRACGMVSRLCDKARFIVIGHGQERVVAEIRRLVDELDLGGKMMFLGLLENPMPYMKAFDVGVLSSLSEGFSNVLLEYGALGVPAVATDVGGNVEIVQNGKTGLLVPPGDPGKLCEAVVDLLRNETLRAELGRNAHEYVSSQFSLKRQVRSYEELYTNLYHKAGDGRLQDRRSHAVQ